VEQICPSKCLGMASGIDFYPVAIHQQLGELVSEWKKLDHPNIMPCLAGANIPDVHRRLYHAIYRYTSDEGG
jgi:hypothetical protein